MPKYLIERSIPGSGTLSRDELQTISYKSNSVLAEMAPRAKWVHSYVTDDKIFCLYIADTADDLREHARRGGFPADAVLAVHAVIDPTTGETTDLHLVQGQT